MRTKGIEYLPDPLLLHVLEFVPAESRAALSLVCQRWRAALDSAAAAHLWERMVVGPFLRPFLFKQKTP